uniref:Uncharacterized protein n=1 Tax=Opuntia streptacantha TaxID=393608 RepID=A0A7C9E6J2_OPUST
MYPTQSCGVLNVLQRSRTCRTMLASSSRRGHSKYRLIACSKLPVTTPGAGITATGVASMGKRSRQTAGPCASTWFVVELTSPVTAVGGTLSAAGIEGSQSMVGAAVNAAATSACKCGLPGAAV